MAIKIFFHICAITRAVDVVSRMISNIHFSGLYDDCDQIYCYISGEEIIINKIVELLLVSGKKFVIIKGVVNDNSFERLTLEDIHNHVDQTDRILYIHSKGVRTEYQDDPNLLVCVDDWTNTMLYYLVRHYKKCLEKLEKYDTVGVNLGYLNDENPHWSGNFWWVRGDYFLTLPHKIGPQYHDPELNFLFLNNPRYYEIHKMNNIDCYHYRYEPFKYIDNKVQ